MNMYLMYDYNEFKYIGEEVWVISTDCPRSEFEELCALSHRAMFETIDGYEHLDFGECCADSECLMLLLEENGYIVEEIWLEVINW